jgi:hypothetical protein
MSAGRTRRGEVVHLVWPVLAQHASDRVGIEQIGVDELDPLANRCEVVVGPCCVAYDADDVVAAAEQQLREIRAVLTADPGDERARRAHCRPRT